MTNKELIKTLNTHICELKAINEMQRNKLNEIIGNMNELADIFIKNGGNIDD